MAAKPEEDFMGYMEGVNRASGEAQAYQAKMEAHRVWRETTWSGWGVRQIQVVGNHFAPFFQKLADLMSDTSSTESILVMALLRLLVIFCAIGFFYLMAYFVQILIGKEYVVEEVEEEEVVIIEDVSEDDDDDNEDEKKSKYTNSAVNRRGKKKKQ